MTPTPDPILTLAPDAGSAASARTLATPARWPDLHAGPTHLWGHCQGSGARPYLTGVDRSGPDAPAFKCSCPSRKFPCKHALALLLLHESHPQHFGTDPAPDAIRTWLDGRAGKHAPPEADTDPAGETRSGPDPTAQAKRRAAREKKVSLGLDGLQTFLQDLVRDGLAQAAGRPYSDWDTQAARLVDAQAPGAARLVRMIPEFLPQPDRLLAHLGRLYLLTEAWPRRATLTGAQQADLRAALGFPLDKAATVAAGGTDTRWLVLGHTVSDEEHVRTRRSWLHEGGVTALLLDFAAPGWPLSPALPAGGSVRARLSPAPGAFPQRHVLDGEATRSAPAPLPAPVTLDGLLDAHGAALALNPWLERTAHHLGPVTVHPPTRDGDAWRAGEAHGSLPLGGSDMARLTLLALGGGDPQTFTAEWDGQTLTPLCAVQDGTLHPLDGGDDDSV
ncbi:hypothetical protein GCM10008956_14480 [Deinococcus arenae]|uniref:SWIM-type domain-containing protein n=1 Tax=Deinococcus arenae TaxID=1452751 RepID=A0A8H9GMK0_9DEIO|nr:SWIM zinc finger family protein [Deinococcus arenae]AWT36443.1 hypothetical protein DM785_13400 [Deinococcus actinosclerus]GGM39117.1 hypothetical protein GCM10008956_14480 [Deinococcus arenae]